MITKFPAMTPPQMHAFAIETERRLLDLRALTGMTQADATHWYQILTGLVGCVTIASIDHAWDHFRRGIVDGQTPAQSAAAFVTYLYIR